MKLTRNNLRKIILEEVKNYKKSRKSLNENITGDKAAAVLALYGAIDMGLNGHARHAASVTRAMRKGNYEHVVNFLNEQYPPTDGSDDLQHYGWYLVSSELGDKGMLAGLPTPVANLFRETSSEDSARAIRAVARNGMSSVRRAVQSLGFDIGGGGVTFKVSGHDLLEAAAEEAAENNRIHTFGSSFFGDMF